MISRVPVLDVRPCILRGTRPARTTVGESWVVEAVLGGTDGAVRGADVVLVDPAGNRRPPVPLAQRDDGTWTADVVADAPGTWHFAVESWLDPIRTWTSTVIDDLDHGADPDGVLAHGSNLLLVLGADDPAAWRIGTDLLDTDAEIADRLAEAFAYVETLEPQIGRRVQESSDAFPVLVESPGALVGAWYQSFPRSDGAQREPDGRVRAGTFATAAKRLEAIAAMGFDTVRLPPVHPRADASPWSVGTARGGHDAVDPELGTAEDLRSYVERARQLGLHVALEMSWEAAPTHPWLQQHPTWWIPARDGHWRLDVDADPRGIAEALAAILREWTQTGIDRFVMTEASSLPAALWEDVLSRLRDLADLVTVAEGDMTSVEAHALTLAGFSQVTPPLHLCTGVRDVAQLLRSIPLAAVRRPHLQLATATRLSAQLATAAEPHVRTWATVSALGAPTWSTCAGLELLESSVVTDGRRMVDDVHGPVVRDWDDPRSLAGLYTRLNELRRLHPALRSRRGLDVHPVHHAGVLVFTRRAPGDEVTVVADLFPAFEKTVGLSEILVTRPDGRVQDQLDGSWHRLDSVPLDASTPVRVLTSGR